MSLPSVRVNTLVQRNDKFSLDLLSKLIIIGECVLGVNRFAVIGETISMYSILIFIYTLVLNAFVTVMTLVSPKIILIAIAANIKLFQFVFCAIFSMLTYKRMYNYYKELHIFDIKIGSKPKLTCITIKISAQIIITFIFAVTVFGLHFKFQNMMYSTPIHLIQVLENHYYGHLLNLLNSRLCLVNNFIEASLSNNKKRTKEQKLTSLANISTDSQMTKLLDIYRTIIDAHDALINAIKWQLLVIITSSFVFILTLSYHIAMGIIRSRMKLSFIISNVLLLVAEFVPLFAPCMSCDHIRAEVQRLRELLASKLYEGNIDKSSRCSARTLLALTEARNLSFSLLRMVDISISLPFNFMGLLVTYLIILLQFEKVIYP